MITEEDIDEMNEVALLEYAKKINRRINSPITEDFLEGVKIEAVHQVERWGSAHDRGKSAFDWFWLIGYLSQKAATAAVLGDTTKALHHTISTAASLLNWHAALKLGRSEMRPGIDKDETERLKQEIKVLEEELQQCQEDNGQFGAGA